MLNRICFIASFLALVTALTSGSAAESGSALERGFAQPPEETKPWVYWYWISDNISKDGITKDLEAMAKAGIGEALIGNVDVNKDSRGSVKVLSEDWWKLVEHAIREGARVGVKIGMFNCPGWSQSGGPWVTPEQTMRYVTISETRVKGPTQFVGKLPKPKEMFQDLAVLAFAAPAYDPDGISEYRPNVACEPATKECFRWFDGNPASACDLPSGNQPVSIDVKVEEPFTARSLVLHPTATPLALNCELQAEDEAGKFKTVRQFTVDRHNPSPQVGPMIYGPVSIGFAPVVSRHFRLVFTGNHPKAGFTEIELSSAARLERFVEKQLGKMFQEPLPLWDAYLWPSQPEIDATNLVINAQQVRDLSKRMDANGVLRWTVPEGDWVILRAGMTPTFVTNSPASPEGSGLEIDKMSRPLIEHHFNSFIGQMLRRMPPQERKGFHRVVADSYEMGSENWTDGFGEDFRRRYGYDPLPWLPVFTGRIVGSAEQSDRFLWDVRRLVADRISKDYVGGLREICRKNGLRLWLENYGHWGYPGEFLQYGGNCEDIGGEFWSSGDLGSIELRAASSAAHTYGKPVISAEAFTSGGPHWELDPWALKKRGDWACTEGINHFVLHVYIEQAYDERVPGVNAWFGVEFNRHNTWWNQAHSWIDYLRRTHFLLQQGKYVADVAYFIGEDTPKMTGVRKPELPSGYSFDYINADVIKERLEVKNGQFVLPDGMSYRLLVLPELTTMRPELLQQLRRLVAAGGAVLGPPPVKSPSLQGYPACDREVQKIADAMWKGCDGKNVTSINFGKGRVFRGIDVQKALDQLAVPADVAGLDRKAFPWTHRIGDEGDIYFISSQADETATITPSFRVAGRQPELWDAVTGSHRVLPECRTENGRSAVPLEFAPRQSVFIVFRKPASPTAGSNFPGFSAGEELSGPWEVSFDPKWGGPASVTFETLQDWTKRDEPGIKYYSGTAIYRKTFHLSPNALETGKRIYLDLGTIKSMGRVTLNGNDLGLVWAAPWRVEITSEVKARDNQLEIEVVNTWANRLTGDSKLSEDQRLTKAVYPHHNPGSPLLPAGLIGPVRILTTEAAAH